MTNLLPCTHWADKLALKPADLAPGERGELDRHLATCPGCAATYRDYQTLIMGLRALPRPYLPPLATDNLTPNEYPFADPPHYGWLIVPPPAPPIPLPVHNRRIWPWGLGAIAAVLLLTMLVGSLVFRLASGPYGGAVSQPYPTFSLRPGWQEITTLSGSGSQTLTELGIPIPQVWSYTIACIGSGDSVIELQGTQNSGSSPNDSFDDTNITNLCGKQVTPLRSPQSFFFADAPGTLDTIKVTVSAQTQWIIQFVQPVNQPTFALGPQWTLFSSISTDTSATQEGLNIGQSSAYQTLGVMLLCFGTGSGTLQLTPDLGRLSFPTCDGQPHFSIAHYPSVTTVQGVNVMVTGDILWLEEIYGCTNQQQCAN